jgi:hypothetical protein
MSLNFSFGLLVLVALLVFLLLGAFGALAIPSLVTVVWLLLGIVLVAIGK